ncbi:GTP-binding protein [Methanolobus sp. ZRKC3]|uniref:GTP-binding protein n=1 Tax=Methanolobus sp. ZRKC3 TaxID=3125786 RepID=UPI0032561A2C
MQIVLIGGFVGTEKKNALFSVGNELITRDKKVAVVVIEDVINNEKKPVGLDSTVMVKEMKDVPCTFITDLMVELPEINKQSNFDYMVIEVPFSLPPGRVREYLANLEFKDLSFAPIIYVFNVNNLKSDARMIPKIVSKQIVESDIIFTNADPTDQETMAALNRTFEEINPDAKIFVHAAGFEGHRISDFVDMIVN